MKYLFENEKEYEMYMKECNKQLLKNTKIGVFLLIVLFTYGILLDFIISGKNFQQLFILHTSQMFFLLIILFLLYKGKITEKNKIILDTIWIVFAVIPICIMIYITGGSISPYYAGLNVVIIAVTQLSIYSLNKVVKFCLIIIVFYMITVFLPQKIPFSWKICYNNLHFIILTSVISCITSYFLTAYRVREFKAKYKIRTLLKEREQAELKLIRSERLNAVGTLAAGIIHEINNPLNNKMKKRF